MKKHVSSFVLFLAFAGLAVAPALAQPEAIHAPASPRSDFDFQTASEPLSADFLLFFAVGGLPTKRAAALFQAGG